MRAFVVRLIHLKDMVSPARRWGTFAIHQTLPTEVANVSVTPTAVSPGPSSVLTTTFTPEVGAGVAVGGTEVAVGAVVPPCPPPWLEPVFPPPVVRVGPTTSVGCAVAVGTG